MLNVSDSFGLALSAGIRLSTFPTRGSQASVAPRIHTTQSAAPQQDAKLNAHAQRHAKHKDFTSLQADFLDRIPGQASPEKHKP